MDVEDFSAQEAFVMIGELYVQLRRAESRHEITVEQLAECAQELAQLREEAAHGSNEINPELVIERG